MIGQSKTFRASQALIEKIAACDAPVHFAPFRDPLRDC